MTSIIHGVSPTLTTIAVPGANSLLVNYTTTESGIYFVSHTQSAISDWYNYGSVTTGTHEIAVGVYPCGNCGQAGRMCNLCPNTTSFNITVWLTNGIGAVSSVTSVSNSVKLAVSETMPLTAVPACTADYYEGGCVTLQIQPRVYLSDTEGANMTVPFNVNCNGSFYMRLALRTFARECDRILIGPHSCDSPPADIAFRLRDNHNCKFWRENSSEATFWTAYLWEQTSYERIKNATSTYINLDRAAGYTIDYPFAVTYPSVKVALVEGAEVVATLGDTKVIMPPNILPAGVSGSLYLEVADKKANTATEIARVEVQLANGSEYRVSNLTVPLRVDFPLIPDRCKLPVCNFWDVENNKWSTDGCETISDPAANIYTCSCTHATDFSMLLLDSGVGDCVQVVPHIEPFFTFAAVYILIGLVALFYGSKLMTLCREKCHLEMILEHLGVFAVCVLRTFLSLYQAGLGGSISFITIASISAVPRLLEFFMFSFIVARWGAILHFGMSGPNAFKKVRYFLLAINIFAAAIVLYVFLAFALSPSYDAAIVGEALSAFNGLFLSVGFMVYACWLHKQFALIDSNSRASRPGGGCGPRRLVWVGVVLSISFIAEGVFACLALSAIPRDISVVPDLEPIIFDLDLYNGLYRLFNVISLSCILVLYHDGVNKIVDNASKTSNSRHSSHNLSKMSV